MILADAAATEAAGAALAAMLSAGDVIMLSGNLGAGKSTFVRGMLRALGHDGDVPSPTFALVIPYEPPGVRLPLWHVDLYRIDAPDEIEALALDEVLADGALAIEWPERLAPAAFADALRLTLVPAGDARRLTALIPPSWERRWPFR